MNTWIRAKMQWTGQGIGITATGRGCRTRVVYKSLSGLRTESESTNGYVTNYFKQVINYLSEKKREEGCM